MSMFLEKVTWDLFFEQQKPGLLQESKLSKFGIIASLDRNKYAPKIDWGISLFFPLALWEYEAAGHTCHILKYDTRIRIPKMSLANSH